MIINKKTTAYIWILVITLLVALVIPSTIGLAASDDSALFNFENGEVHGLYATDGNKGAVTISNDTSKANAGSGSAKLSVDFTNGIIELGIDNPGDTIEAGAIVGMMVYIPAGTEVNFQPYVFGSGWEWNGTWYNGADLEKDKWVPITVKLNDGAAPSTRLGLQLFQVDGSDQTAVEVWVDSIGVYDESGKLIGAAASDEPAAEEPAADNPKTGDAGLTLLLALAGVSGVILVNKKRVK